MRADISPGLAVRQLGEVLRQAPAYHALARDARRDLESSLARIQDVLGPSTGLVPLARQMAPDLRSQLAPQDGGLSPSPAQSPQAAPSQPAPASSSAPATGPVGRAGEVARATLNAIDFPSFVASLIQGTFQAIVDASIQ